MHAPKIQIDLSNEAQLVLNRLRDSSGVLKAVCRAMDLQNQLTVGHIIERRMRGNDNKPFPVELHVLGIRTARYSRSLRTAKAVTVGTNVWSGIGSNVKYAGIHEFGGRINMPPRQGKARLRVVGKSEELMRQAGFPNLAVFAKRKHKKVREVDYTTKGHTINIPARAPVTTGIEDRQEAYGVGVSRAIVDFWEKQA